MDELVYLIRTQRRRLNFFQKKYPGELYITRGHQMRMLCARYTVILHLKMCESKLFKE